MRSTKPLSSHCDAARHAGVGLLADTSLLHADRSPLGLAGEHSETEALLRASGLPHVLLRNGWYTENYLASVTPALQYGVLLGRPGQSESPPPPAPTTPPRPPPC